MSAVISETGGGVVRVPISDLRCDNWGDPPSDDFVKSVGEKMYQPILVRVHDEGPEYYLELLDGRRRAKAAMMNGEDAIDAVLDEGEGDPRKASLVTNYLRNENVSGSARIVWSYLDEGKTDHDIAADHKMKLATVRGLRDMRKLDPRLFSALESGAMKEWAARHAARQPESVQSRLVAILEETGRVTADDVIAERKVKQEGAVADLGDMFEGDLPELDGRPLVEQLHNPEEGDFDELRSELEAELPETIPSIGAAVVEAASKPKVKITREQRYENVRDLIAQARKEILSIKSNTRVDEDVFILGYFDEINTNLDILQSNVG